MKCLDTTFLIDFLRGDQSLAKNRQLFAQGELCTTTINVFEILLGIQVLKNETQRGRELRNAVALFQSIATLPLDHHGAMQASEICGSLIRDGAQIDEHDCMTAGTALAHGVTAIITRDIAHFQRIPNITVERH